MKRDRRCSLMPPRNPTRGTDAPTCRSEVAGTLNTSSGTVVEATRGGAHSEVAEQERKDEREAPRQPEPRTRQRRPTSAGCCIHSRGRCCRLRVAAWHSRRHRGARPMPPKGEGAATTEATGRRRRSAKPPPPPGQAARSTASQKSIPRQAVVSGRQAQALAGGQQQQAVVGGRFRQATVARRQVMAGGRQRQAVADVRQTAASGWSEGAFAKTPWTSTM